MSKPPVYDAGALILADRDDRAFWLRHRALLGQKVVPLVPAGVVAQVSRDPRQVRLRRLLKGCYVVPLSDAQAHAAGALLGRSGTSDVLDATVAVVAATSGAAVFTSDPHDVRHLLDALGSRVAVLTV